MLRKAELLVAKPVASAEGGQPLEFAAQPRRSHAAGSMTTRSHSISTPGSKRKPLTVAGTSRGSSATAFESWQACSSPFARAPSFAPELFGPLCHPLPSKWLRYATERPVRFGAARLCTAPLTLPPVTTFAMIGFARFPETASRETRTEAILA